jgi:hypothetical protein
MILYTMCLRQWSVKKAKKVRSLSPPGGALLRIGAVERHKAGRTRRDA